jgi:hypothetical protein
MKTKLSLILGGMLLVSHAAMAATAVPLTVSATVPSASGLVLTVATYDATTGAVEGTPSTTATTLPFNTLSFVSATGTYAPAVYYSVAIGTSGGAGAPIVNVTYTEGTGTACPNIAAGLSATLGCLGTKSTATFVTAVPSNATTNPNQETVSSLGKKRLIDLTGTVGQLSTVPAGQYEKVYVGLWNGNPADSPADPSNGLPFTNGDASGTYTGTLTFTATTL